MTREKELLLVLLILFLCFSKCFAGDWLCTEEASQRRGSSVLACGIGHGASEEEARDKALDAAAVEFKKICDLSSDCHRENVKANPQRTECEKERTGYSCRRLVQFEMAEMPKEIVQAKSLDYEFYKQFLIKRLGMPSQISRLGWATEWFYDSKEICAGERQCGITICISESSYPGRPTCEGKLSFSDQIRPDVQMKLEAALGQK